jgi:MFS family permease
MLLVVFALAGAALGGSRLGFWKYVLDTVQPSDRRLCMGLLNTLNSPSLAMPLIGGVILGLAGYTWLFLISAACGVLALLTALALRRASK